MNVASSVSGVNTELGIILALLFANKPRKKNSINNVFIIPFKMFLFTTLCTFVTKDTNI